MCSTRDPELRDCQSPHHRLPGRASHSSVSQRVLDSSVLTASRPGKPGHPYIGPCYAMSMSDTSNDNLGMLTSFADETRMSISAMVTVVKSIPSLKNAGTAKVGYDLYRKVALDLERPITNLAIAAHKSGHSWSSIGASLGVSEGTARDLFSGSEIEPGSLARHLDGDFDTALG